jgi:hypothetical protein
VRIFRMSATRGRDKPWHMQSNKTSCPRGCDGPRLSGSAPTIHCNTTAQCKGQTSLMHAAVISQLLLRADLESRQIARSMSHGSRMAHNDDAAA